MKDNVVTEVARLLNRLSRLEPSPEAMDRAQQRTRAALAGAAPVPVTASRKNRWARRLVSTAAIAATILIVLAVVGVGWPGRASRPAFAAVQDAIEELTTVVYTGEVPAGEVSPGFGPCRVAVELATGRIRHDDHVSGAIMICDLQRHAMMNIFPKERRAILHENVPMGADLAETRDFFRHLRQARPEGFQRLADGEIDGRKVEQYRLPRDKAALGGVEGVVFVAAADHLPVRIEGSFEFPDHGHRICHFTLKDFRYNQADGSLWAFTAPDGYRLEKYDGSAREQTPIANP
jgi:hypothetical protein